MLLPPPWPMQAKQRSHGSSSSLTSANWPSRRTPGNARQAGLGPGRALPSIPGFCRQHQPTTTTQGSRRRPALARTRTCMASGEVTFGCRHRSLDERDKQRNQWYPLIYSVAFTATLRDAAIFQPEPEVALASVLQPSHLAPGRSFVGISSGESRGRFH